MKAFQQALAYYERLNAQVLGVSPDNIETHEKFASSLGLEFPLVSDPGGAIQLQYGPGRVTFVIDMKGVIRFVQDGMPNNDKLLTFIESLAR